MHYDKSFDVQSLVHNAFDWDQPDAVMERSNVEIITEE